jgi:hypothetical protein
VPTRSTDAPSTSDLTAEPQQHLPSSSVLHLSETTEKRPAKRSRTSVWDEKIAEQKFRKLLLENRLLELQIQEKEAQLMVTQSNLTDFLLETNSNAEIGKNEPLD